jgi:hypothetical protein
VAGTGAGPAVSAVTESLSQLRLGRADQTNRQTRSTAAYPHDASIQQPDVTHAVTAALSHMHFDTPTGADSVGQQPFGTPRASAAMGPQLQPFDSAFHTAPVPSAAALRHRQRSLSPTVSQGVTAAGSSTPQPQQHQRGPSLELQQQRQHGGRGRLHPSESKVAINTMPDSAGAGLGAAVGQHDGGHPPVEQGNYLRLEVCAAAQCAQCADSTRGPKAEQPAVSRRADGCHPSRPLVSAKLEPACIVRMAHRLWRAVQDEMFVLTAPAGWRVCWPAGP